MKANIYKSNPNKTAQSIVDSICNNKKNITVGISKDGYDWLYMNANSLAHLVEELLADRLGGEYYVVITREKEYGEYIMHVEYNEVTNE